MKMKLTAGLGSVDDYLSYVRAGADEVFIGYVPQIWQETWGLQAPLNRREVCFYNVQIGSRSELEILAEQVKRCGVPAVVTFNALQFREEQLSMAAEIMKECLSLGFDSVIISSPALLVYLKEIGLSEQLRIHISGEAGEINHLILREYARLGARRLIFHRKVSAENMAAIIREQRKWEAENGVSPMEFEAFLLNENCHFHGAFCNTLHCDDLVPMCRMPYRLGTEENSESIADQHLQNGKNGSQDNRGKASREFLTSGLSADESAEAFTYDYGLGRLKQLEAIGITHLKIVGRGADGEFMSRCIRLARQRLDEMT